MAADGTPIAAERNESVRAYRGVAPTCTKTLKALSAAIGVRLSAAIGV
jgi:hypothetical protein